MATECAVPGHVCRVLTDVLGEGAGAVRVFERSLRARLHGPILATTRPNRIYLTISGEAFFADPALVLHEYYHVLAQWNTGRLTRRRYLWELLRRGYRNNCFEVEARRFVRDHAEVLERLSAGSADR